MPRRYQVFDYDRHAPRTAAEYFLDGYYYNVSNKKKNTTYLYCQQRNLLKCPGRAKLIGNTIVCTNDHKYHEFDNSFQKKIAFRNDLLQACVKQFRTVSVIYREISMMHKDAAADSNPKTLKDAMRTWRRNHQEVPQVHSIREFRDILYNDEWEQLRWYGCRRNSIDIFVLNADQLTEAMVLFDVTLSRYVRDCAQLYIEKVPIAIFECGHIKELIVVGAVKNNSIFPFWLACVRNSDFESYRCIIEHLAQLIADPTTIFTNYNNELHHVLMMEFPNCTIKGSFHHFCNEIFGKAQELAIPDNNDSDVLMKKIMALGLLPENIIQSTFEKCKEAMPIGLRAIYSNLLQYVNDIWIERAGTNQISNFDNLDAIADGHRTLYHLVCNSIGSESSVWDILKFMQKMCSKCLQNKSKIERDSRPSADMLIRHLIDKRTLTHQWTMIMGGDIKIERFLAISSYLLTELYKNVKLLKLRASNDRQIVLLDLENVDADEEQVVPFIENIFDEFNPHIEPQLRDFNNAIPEVENEMDENPENLFDGEEMAAIADDRGNGLQQEIGPIDGMRGDAEIPVGNEIDREFPPVGFHYEDNLEPRDNHERFLNRQDIEELLQSLRNTPHSKQKSIDNLECLLCGNFKREYMMLPCGHFILCHDCTITFLDVTVKNDRYRLNCPACRTRLTKIQRVYL